jgi:hypothetical protein
MKAFLSFLLLLLASILPLHANEGQAIRKEDINDIMRSVAKTYDCEDRLAAEKMDGLIVLDFRKVKSPPFMTKPYDWNVVQPYEWNRARPREYGNSYMNNRHYFNWKLDSINSKDLSAVIRVDIFSTYEDAREKFIRTERKFKTFNLLVPCKNNVGTICAKDMSLFFVYKNVFVEIVAFSFFPDDDPLQEELAAWLFGVLERHPRTWVFPEALDDSFAADPELNQP